MTNDYTRYSYRVDVDVDDESGQVTAFVYGLECGEVGEPVKGDFDRDTAREIGRAILRDVRHEHFDAGEPETRGLLDEEESK